MDIEPDVIVTEVLKKSSKKRKDEEVHEEHCGCGCESEHEGHEHHHHQHHHDHDEDHCDCDCCDDDDDDEGTIAAATKRQGNGKATVFIVEKLGCAHCAGKMEEQISHLPGVEAVNLTFATKQLRVWSDDAKALLPQIQDICTSIEPDVKVVIREDTVRAQKEAKNNSEDNREYLELGIGIVLFIAGKIFESSKPVYSTACFLLAYLILGIKIVWTALRNISKGQVFDENFLMSIATIGAFGIGEYAEAVGVMLFYRIGELFEEKAVERSRSQIMDVIDMRPEVVNLVNEHGDVSVIDAEEAEIGDILLVRPGDRIPLDGVITDGETMIDTSPVTGEPVPISGFEGTEVTSGCLNTSGVIKIRVEKVLEESMVQESWIQLKMQQPASRKWIALLHVFPVYIHHLSYLWHWRQQSFLLS